MPLPAVRSERLAHGLGVSPQQLAATTGFPAPAAPRSRACGAHLSSTRLGGASGNFGGLHCLEKSRSSLSDAWYNGAFMPSHASRRVRVLRILLPLLVLGLGIVAFRYLARPRSPMGQAEKRVLRLEVTRFEGAARELPLTAFGRVRAGEVLGLKAEVGGKVAGLSAALFPGKRVKRGQWLVRLDQNRLELARSRARANLETAQVELRLEKQRQRIAASEWERFKGQQAGEDAALALRDPQVRAAELAAQAAASDLRAAELDLEAATLYAPVDALVQSRAVARGETITPGQVLAELIAIDQLWLEVTLMPSVAARLAKQQAEAVVSLREGQSLAISGSVRGLGESDAQTGLTRVIIGLDVGALPEADVATLPGAYATARFAGESVADVFELPSRFLKGDGQLIAVDDGRAELLSVRVIESEAEGGDSVLVQVPGRDALWLSDAALSEVAPGAQVEVVERPTSEKPTAKVR